MQKCVFSYEEGMWPGEYLRKYSCPFLFCLVEDPTYAPCLVLESHANANTDKKMSEILRKTSGKQQPSSFL